MTILESWQNKNGNAFAIARGINGSFDVLWEYDDALWPLDSALGIHDGSFDTIDAARAFLLWGFELEDANPEIWHQLPPGSSLKAPRTRNR